MKIKALEFLKKYTAPLRAYVQEVYSKHVKGRVGRARLIKFIKEYTALIMAFVVYFVSPYVLRLIDPTAGSYDAGVLQIMVIATIQFAVFQAITWSVVKNIWPAIGAYMKEFFNADFLKLDPWQRILISVLVYFAVFTALVMLSRVYQ